MNNRIFLGHRDDCDYWLDQYPWECNCMEKSDIDGDKSAEPSNLDLLIWVNEQCGRMAVALEEGIAVEVNEDFLESLRELAVRFGEMVVNE